MNPSVKDVTALNNYKLQLSFTNGEKGLYDCSHLLDFGIFSELKQEEYFKQVEVVHGTIAWPHGQDICPDTLYITACVENRNI